MSGLGVPHAVVLGVLAAYAGFLVLAVLRVAGRGRRRLERRGGLLELDSPAARRALLTWECMICGRRRPDADIAVASSQVGWVTINIRYCAGDDSCRKAAQARAAADAIRLGEGSVRP